MSLPMVCPKCGTGLVDEKFENRLRRRCNNCSYTKAEKWAKRRLPNTPPTQLSEQPLAYYTKEGYMYCKKHGACLTYEDCHRCHICGWAVFRKNRMLLKEIDELKKQLENKEGSE